MIPAVVLAAGKSTRMGRLKATLPIGDSETFLSRIVRSYHEAGIEDVVIVVGHDAELVRASLATDEIGVRFIENPAYESGQFSSFVKGLDAVDRPGVSAALVTLVDVPLVSAATISTVVEHYRRTRAPIVRPTRGNEHGHPVLIDRAVFGALRRADAATGMKPIVRAHASQIGDIAIDDPGAFIDIDTVEEYRRVIETMDRAR
jgi:molybdenum cofactor cytidylyltransferase